MRDLVELKTLLNMYWGQFLKTGDKYCTCHAQWKTFQIINAVVLDIIMQVFLTAEGGTRTQIFSLNRGQEMSTNIPIFHFSHNQHIKIEVIGGMISLVGTVYEGGFKDINVHSYKPSCVYSEIDAIVFRDTNKLYNSKTDIHSLNKKNQQKPLLLQKIVNDSKVKKGGGSNVGGDSVDKSFEYDDY